MTKERVTFQQTRNPSSHLGEGFVLVAPGGRRQADDSAGNGRTLSPTLVKGHNNVSGGVKIGIHTTRWKTARER